MIGEYLEDDWISENYKHLISNIDTHDSYMWFFYLFMLYQKNMLIGCLDVWMGDFYWLTLWVNGGGGGGGHGMKGSYILYFNILS